MASVALPDQRFSLKRVLHRALVYFSDLAAFAISTCLAFVLFFDGAPPARYLYPMGLALCIWAAAKSAAFIAFKVHRGHWRHTSAYDAVRILAATSAGSILGGSVILLLVGR